MVGAMAGNIQDMEEEEEEDSDPEEQVNSAPSKQKTGGMFSVFK